MRKVVDRKIKCMTLQLINVYLLSIQVSFTNCLVGDIGGSVGLCLGGSILTLFEIINLITGTRRRREKHAKRKEYCNNSSSI